MSQKPRKIVSLTLIKFPDFLKRFDVRIFTVRIFIVTSLYELSVTGQGLKELLLHTFQRESGDSCE